MCTAVLVTQDMPPARCPAVKRWLFWEPVPREAGAFAEVLIKARWCVVPLGPVPAPVSAEPFDTCWR